MSKLSDRIIQVLIRKDISIHAQLFRFMSLLGTIAMAVGGVYTLAEGMEIKNVAALFAGVCRVCLFLVSARFFSCCGGKVLSRELL